jgi:hypothetical protein
MPTLTINIAGRGTPLALDPFEGPKESNVGHMWYSVTDSRGRSYSYGFSPIKGASYYRRLAGPGDVNAHGQDDSFYLRKDYSKSINITQTQYDKLVSFGDNPELFGFSKDYHFLFNSCVDFTWKALQVADLNPAGFQGDIWPTLNINNIEEFLVSPSPSYISPVAESFANAIRLQQLRRLIDPIVLDLDGNGIELTARASSNVYFDMDGDGIKEQTGWVKPTDGLLAIDSNGNGKIDNINELIGDLGRSGFAELVTYDSNKDKVIDAKDAV